MGPTSHRPVRPASRFRRALSAGLAATASAVIVVASTPSPASADPFTYVDVSTGYHAACAVTNDGSAVCWGWNRQRALGTADTSEKVMTPSRVSLPGGQRFASVSVGDGATVCGITTTGTAYCWGEHHLGNYFSPTSTVPVPVELPASVWVRSLANGGSIACAVSTQDELWCWGDVLDFGNGSTEATRTPERVPMPDGSRVLSVDAGPGVTCAVTSTSRLYCWGVNGDGETGIGYLSNKVSLPVAVPLPPGVVPATVSAGLGRVCTLDTTGTGWCWGDNYEGSFGDGTYTDSRTPRRVLTPDGEALVSLQTAWYHTCGTGTSGTTWCWGRGGFGELGTGTTLGGKTFRLPVLPAGVTLARISVGLATTCAIDNSSRIWCWTGSDWGVAGTGDLTKSLFPRLIAPIGSPSVADASATDVTAESATLRAAVNPNGMATTWAVELSTDPGFAGAVRRPGGTTITGGRYLPVDAVLGLTSLSPRTTYHARVVATNEHGTVTGGPVTFTTLGTEPVITDVSVGDVGGTTARVSLTVHPGLLRTSVRAEVSASSDFSGARSVELDALSGAASESREATVDGLAPRTVHHLRVVATNRLGTTVSGPVTFTTTGREPSVTGTAATATARSVTVTATIDGGGLAGSAVARLSPDEDLSGAVVSTPVNWSEGSAPRASFTFTDLAPRTAYFVRITATNVLGDASGAVVDVTTRGGAPELGSVTIRNVDTTSADVEAEVDATGLPTSVTVQVAADATFTEDLDEYFLGRFTDEGAVSRRLALVDLRPGRTYFVRYAATNAAGTVRSAAATFATPRPVGIEINDGDESTADTTVTLRVTAPSGAVALRIADNAAMRNARVLPVTGSVPWTLAAATDGPTVRGVWVTFHDETGRVLAMRSDTITVVPPDDPAPGQPGADEPEDPPADDVAPVVLSARVVKVSTSGAKSGSSTRTRLSVAGRDSVSGITQVQIRTKSGTTRHNVTARKSLSGVFAAPARSGMWVRLVDAAGNSSKWVRVKG